MKKIIVFFLIFLFGKTVVAQDVLDTSVEIQVNKKSIQQILKDLESNYPIFFSYGKLNLSRKKSVQFKGSLRKALIKIFEGENVTWTAVEDYIVLKYTRIKGQPIRGLILDEDSQTPLIGANVLIKNTTELVGASTDLDGYFTISNLIVGRYDLEVQYIGYETFFINQVLVTSGKDVFLNINLKESVMALEEVVIVAELQKDLTEPLNDMATLSARSFNIAETQRFAASISDPARIAQSFAGVSGGGDDLANDIIIRGNSTRGLLWMMEGVEIPNPNHFAEYISNGGYVSMLSASTLSDSDFFTGAFPAQYGNAISGVFDLNLRNGNKDKREFTLSMGTLGLDFTTEGYFSKKSNASYLFNFRYSIIELFLKQWLITEQGRDLNYRDANFKINVPTKKAGKFVLFGIAGNSFDQKLVVQDSTQWKTVNDRIKETYERNLFTIGLTHRYLLNDRSYLKSAFLFSEYKYGDDTQVVVPQENYLPVSYDRTMFRNYGWTASIEYNLKRNNRNTFKIGSSLQSKKFEYDFKAIGGSVSVWDIVPGFDNTLISYLNNSGGTEFLQGYFQWQNRFAAKWEINAGVHFSYLFLNQTYGIDPRFGIKWRFQKDKSFALSAGLHSKPEQTSTLLISREDVGDKFPNKNLKMLRAFHLIGAYQHKITSNLRLLIEPYYQYLYDIPVSRGLNNSFSILNGRNVFDIIFSNDYGKIPLVSEGKGWNYGIDMTIEKFFSDNYYFLITSSLFNSEYSTIDRKIYNTRYANNFILNLLAGKEWLLTKQKNKVLGVNLKYTHYVGSRYTPIDLQASIQAGEGRIFPNSYFSEHIPAYKRLDVGVSFKINKPNLTHSFLFDIQNILDRENVAYRFYSQGDEKILNETQNGLIPFVTYRIEFSGKEK